MSTAFRPTAGGPRITGLLNLALDQAITAIDDAVGSRHPDLRPAHLQVFRYGSIEGRRTTDLAALARITKQSMHELVGHFERHGYLVREPNPADRRARILRLTEKGRALEREIVAASSSLHLEWHAQLGEELFGALWSALGSLTGQQGSPPEIADLRERAAATRPRAR